MQNSPCGTWGETRAIRTSYCAQMRIQQLGNKGMQHAVSIIDFLLDVRLDFRVRMSAPRRN